MPASEDDAGIPRVITARTPGYVPPKEYVQFLDMGGELAQLSSLTEVKALKAAVLLLKNRSMAELGIAIDETGQADEKDRDKIDDMPAGNDQLVAARSLLAQCLTVPNDMLVYLKTRPASELRRFAINLGCDRQQCYEAIEKPEKCFELAKLIYASDKFNQYAPGIDKEKRSVPEDPKPVEPPPKRTKPEDVPIDLTATHLDRFLSAERKKAEDAAVPPNPTPTPALGDLSSKHTLDGKAEKISVLSDDQMVQLREMVKVNTHPAEITKFLTDHMVETARGDSKTIEELALAAKQPGLQGKRFTKTLLGMPPVSAPIGYVGVQPSLKQCFLPDDKKNLLLPSMFNPDPNETESDRLYKASLSLTTDPSSASQSDALISKLLNHSNSEKAKKLRRITSVNQWIIASLSLAQYAIATTPQTIPNCALALYYKYVTEYSDEMKANGAEKSKEILALYVKHDELLRFSWGNTLSPENHLFDYQNSSLAMKHLLQPLMQLQSKTVRLLASKANIAAFAAEDNDDDDDDDDDDSAPRIKRKKGKKVVKKKKPNKTKVTDAMKNWPGTLAHAISLRNIGGKDEHLMHSDGVTKICALFNFSKGCYKTSCQDSHHCAFCGENHSIRDCSLKP